MSRHRVYEVARNLGIESRELIAHLQALGVEGISNHMNVVDPDDVIRIRDRLNNKDHSIEAREYFVGGLPPEIDESILREAFAACGTVRDVKVIRDRETGASRGFGFVAFASDADFDEVPLKEVKIAGRPLTIDKKREQPGVEFFVGGLAKEVDDTLLAQAFTHFGIVYSARVIRDHQTGKSRGFGFVAFAPTTNVTEETLKDFTLWGQRLRIKPKVAVLGKEAATTREPTQLVRQPRHNQLLAREPRAEWIELKANEADAVLVKYDRGESRKILDQFRKLDLGGETQWHAGSLAPAVADQLANASGIVATGLQAGQVFQVIGTPQLVEGLKAGTYALMQTAEGTLGTVVSSSSGQIAGQLRFAQASLAPILAPVLAWQLLHGIAGTTQLRKINHRLDVMQRKLETLQARNEAGVLGEVRWAVRTLQDILDERDNTGTFSQDMRFRLALVEKSIGSIFERNRALADLFHSKAESVKNTRGKTGAVRATAFLQEEGPQAIHDMELLVGLAAADLRVEEARLYAAMEFNQGDVQRRLDAVTKKVDEYRCLIAELPSVEAIAEHAQNCVDEMGWWQRHVFARRITEEAEAIARIELHDVRVSSFSQQSTATNGYVFWCDDMGKTQVRMLSGG